MGTHHLNHFIYPRHNSQNNGSIGNISTLFPPSTTYACTSNGIGRPLSGKGVSDKTIDVATLRQLNAELTTAHNPIGFRRSPPLDEGAFRS